METRLAGGSQGAFEHGDMELCGVHLEEPATSMVVELFRRDMAGQSTQVCDLVSSCGSPMAKAYKALDKLLSFGLINVTATGRRFRQVELSQGALRAMNERFQYR